MQAARSYDDRLGRQVTRFPAPGIAQAGAGTNRPVVEQGQEVVMIQTVHSPFSLIAANGIDEGRHELFACIAL